MVSGGKRPVHLVASPVVVSAEAGGTALGSVQFHDGTGWHAATIAVVPSTGQLVVDAEDRAAAAISLRRVSGVDEILGGTGTNQHLEISVDGEVTVDVVWPIAMTAALTDALHATVATPAADVPRPAELPGARVLAVDAVAVDGAHDTERTPRVGIIATLAVVGVAAITLGVVGLVSRSGRPSAPTRTVTTTVVEGADACSPDAADCTTR